MPMTNMASSIDASFDKKVVNGDIGAFEQTFYH